MPCMNRKGLKNNPLVAFRAKRMTNNQSNAVKHRLKKRPHIPKET